MSDHKGQNILHCPTCRESASELQSGGGTAYSAVVIEHEAATNDELDLAAILGWIEDTHQPDPDGNCQNCGEPPLTNPHTTFNIPCSEVIEFRLKRNMWIIDKIQQLNRKNGRSPQSGTP